MSPDSLGCEHCLATSHLWKCLQALEVPVLLPLMWAPCPNPGSPWQTADRCFQGWEKLSHSVCPRGMCGLAIRHLILPARQAVTVVCAAGSRETSPDGSRREKGALCPGLRGLPLLSVLGVRDGPVPAKVMPGSSPAPEVGAFPATRCPLLQLTSPGSPGLPRAKAEKSKPLVLCQAPGLPRQSPCLASGSSSCSRF